MHSILVVDDEAPIRELLSRWLESGRFEVREADSAELSPARGSIASWLDSSIDPEK